MNAARCLWMMQLYLQTGSDSLCLLKCAIEYRALFKNEFKEFSGCVVTRSHRGKNSTTSLWLGKISVCLVIALHFFYSVTNWKKVKQPATIWKINCNNDIRLISDSVLLCPLFLQALWQTAAARFPWCGCSSLIRYKFKEYFSCMVKTLYIKDGCKHRDVVHSLCKLGLITEKSQFLATINYFK